MTQSTTIVPLSHVPKIDGAGLTHVGRVRERNEDAILTDPSGALWAVADGMGGHGQGDVASDLVVEVLASIPDEGEPRELLLSRLEAANADVHRRGRKAGVMGATVVALLLRGWIGHVAWAGDSRAYLVRGGVLERLTQDHSVVQEMIDRGELAPEAAARHPDAHVVTRAVGAASTLEPGLMQVELAPADRLVLCSDGLSACVSDARIACLVGAALTAEAACRSLVATALDEGAPDNVSIIVVIVGEG